MIRHLALISFCLLVTDIAFSQSAGLSHDALQEKLNTYSKIHPSSLLFVHTDKTLYTNNETIWFSAYLVNSGIGDISDHSILSVSLMREDDRRIWKEDKYLMKDGVSNGSLVIPDTLPPGNYLFNAFTNVLDKKGNPIVVFSQPVTIKSISQRSFDATLSLLDTVVVNGLVRARVSVDIKEPRPKEKQKEKVTVRYSTTGSTDLPADLTGNSAVITIPAAQLTGAAPVLLTTVKYDKELIYLSVKLPKVQSKGLQVRFFPEGGSLSDGLESTVALETRTIAGLPVSMTGILYKNEQPVDTISTTSYGVTTFRLKPDITGKYTFKVKVNAFLDRDTSYTLPKILENGMVLHFADAIVNDTLRMILFSKQAGKVQVAIHNYKEDFAFFETTPVPQGKKISIDLKGLPKGIATVTVLDEQGRPLAERLFFAHYDEKITASIKTEKALYNKRDSVQVTLTLKDKEGKPVQGLASIAAVQDNRIEGAKQQDIESYVYLNHDLGTLPRDPQGRGISNKIYLEDIFLIKGWRKYTWQDLLKSKVADTVVKGTLPEISANLYFDKSTLRKPGQIIVHRDSLVDLIMTEKDGSFFLPEDKIRITEGRKVLLIPSDKPEYKPYYSFKVNDPFPLINQKIADMATPTPKGIAKNEISSNEHDLQDMQKTNILQTVTIKAKNDDSIYGTLGKPGANPCGDFVCINGVLNCPVHTPSSPGSHQPIAGHLYFILTNKGTIGPRVPYIGCVTEPTVFPINGIYIEREFYGLDRDPVSGQSPQYLSTLFWKPGLITNEKGELSFSFFTGDITGKFRIVAQGIGLKDMIFGEGSFTVK